MASALLRRRRIAAGVGRACPFSGFPNGCFAATTPGSAPPAPPGWGGWDCRGRQRWRAPSGRKPCLGEEVGVVQRGKSTPCFPVPASALDIPPYSSSSYQASVLGRLRQHALFEALLK